jgi:predicted esterase
MQWAARWTLILWMGPILAAFAADATDAPKGLQRDVVFGDYSPMSSTAQLLQRVLSPLYAARMRQTLARSGQALRDQSIDLSHEHFTVYVPPEMPKSGYALLVFVLPWQSASLPAGWSSVLDRHGVIFVSAARSGNEENIFDRREPLALLATENILHRYSVDPERIYVGGFSGGARVALRLALGYPDVFHGALLSASGDPIGDADAPLPAPDLFRQFQSSTRVVYLTGEYDSLNLQKDVESRMSLRDWCVFDQDTRTMPRLGHEIADPSSFDAALDSLAQHEKVAAARLADCRARIDANMNAQLSRLADLVTHGKLKDASALLNRIDARFGGLAAPRSVELWQQIESPR